jgi:predicted DCC family thiol-disulfide oxidoreductase YuxK
MDSRNHITVLFDGVCNLCNGTVQFIIKRDRAAIFRFASLQSDYAHALLRRLNLPADQLYSVIVIEDGIAYQKSDAALRIARRLPGFWRWLYIFRFIPKFIRDGLYNFIATNRYRFFGKKDHCMIPTPELKARFFE